MQCDVIFKSSYLRWVGDDVRSVVRQIVHCAYIHHMISISTIKDTENIQALELVSLKRLVLIDWEQNHPTVCHSKRKCQKLCPWLFRSN